MTRQQITIEIDEYPDGAVHWRLFGATGKLITDSTRWGDKMPYSSADGALTGAAKAAHKLLWIERSCN